MGEWDASYHASLVLPVGVGLESERAPDRGGRDARKHKTTGFFPL